MVFSFLTAYSLQQLFPQLTVHNNFFTATAQPNRPLTEQGLIGRCVKIALLHDALHGEFRIHVIIYLL
jgi:hypothetical protein